MILKKSSEMIVKSINIIVQFKVHDASTNLTTNRSPFHIHKFSMFNAENLFYDVANF